MVEEKVRYATNLRKQEELVIICKDNILAYALTILLLSGVQGLFYPEDLKSCNHAIDEFLYRPL
jgi:hypothetical protein